MVASGCKVHSFIELSEHFVVSIAMVPLHAIDLTPNHSNQSPYVIRRALSLFVSVPEGSHLKIFTLPHSNSHSFLSTPSTFLVGSAHVLSSPQLNHQHTPLSYCTATTRLCTPLSSPCPRYHACLQSLTQKFKEGSLAFRHHHPNSFLSVRPDPDNQSPLNP